MRSGVAIYDQVNGQQEEIFGSDKGHFLVDLDYVPNRFNVVEVTPTDLTSSNGTVVEEVLVDVKHGLLYVPRVIVFFYVKSGEFLVGQFFQPTGSYTSDTYFWSSGAGPQDTLYHTVDDTHFKVIHRYVEPSSTPSTSSSNLRTFDIKYLIGSLKGPIVRFPNS